jgi:Domain of unknown function (DUF4082)/Right handed beta helix region
MGRSRLGMLSAITVIAVVGGTWAISQQSKQTTLLETVSRPAATAGVVAGGYEIGQRFVLTADAKIAGLTFTARVPRSGNRSGDFVVHLWSANGTLLATGRETAATANTAQSGRRYRDQHAASFSKPVELSKGTQFTASFWSAGLRRPPVPSASAIKRTGPATAGALVYHKGPGFPDVAGPVGDYPLTLVFAAPDAPPTPTPTPAPPSATATPPGSGGGSGSGGGTSATGCAAKPSSCGFPDETNTGATGISAMKAGESSSGKGWHYDSRGWLEVDGDGAVVENLTLTHGIDITADNVTIRNVKIRTGGEGFGIGVRHAKNVTIEDSTIYGPEAGSGRLMVAIKDVYSDSANLKILRNNLYNTSTAIQVDSGLVQDNYIHDLGFKSGDHLNGTTSNAGNGPLTLRHNTVFNSFQQTDAISLFEDFGTQKNRVIDNNLMAGGGYTLYGGANPGGAATSNIKVTNNHFSRMYFPNGGYYGPVTAFDADGSGNEWSGNVWDETGATIRP